MPGLTRSANPLLTYAGQDVTADWVPALLNLTWRKSVGESTQKNADSITLTLADPTGYFRQNYDLKCKQTLQLQVESHNWNYPGEHLLSDATEMHITRVEIEGSKDRGTVVMLTASSIDPATHFRLTKKSRNVEKSDLKTVAAQVAKDNGWTLQYTAKVNPQLAHAEQHDQSDATFLQRFCVEHDLYFRVRNKVLVIGSMADLESQPPQGTIIAPVPGNPGGINGRGIISWRLEEDIEDTYANAIVSSKDAKTGKVTTGIAADADQAGPTHNETKKPVGPVVEPEPGATIEPGE